MGILARYKNGNLTTTLYSDGTRIRETQDDEFRPAFAENVDVHISDCCNNNCPMCYANCTPDGKFADLFNWKFLDSVHPGTEMALNLNFPFHADIEQFLHLLKDKGIIANVTINQNHFMEYTDFVRHLVDHELIHGLGISLTTATPEFVETVKQFPNAVIHVINGIFDVYSFNTLADNDLKILILGYKDIGRGVAYHNTNALVDQNKKWLYDFLGLLLNKFAVVSFDNLALEQLNVKRFLLEDEWNEFYGGDDGTFTYFLNLVHNYFAKNSLSDVHYPINDLTMDQMFEIIRNAA